MKTYNNTTTKQAKDQVSDLEIWGTSDMWKLICKASSKDEKWMKSTKAMFIGNGCLVQVTTQQGNNIAEAITFVPGVQILEKASEGGKVHSRALIPIELDVFIGKMKEIQEKLDE